MFIMSVLLNGMEAYDEVYSNWRADVNIIST